jgi:alkylhydroperoxidase family enzyme
VRRHAYRVTDADVDALRAAGLGDEQIFELTIATALTVGLERLR